ncbi:hypothetical protein CBOM_07580 [Ceraceosorus bombacis]|uniref:Uncharacterized protein n=1 Tax=Ceraceosorus bombacis TaxID=401625 RepID=A0A0P1BH06_9BASI|nr:hypothetical protein CBOM_07580 [Ceraceosorus bombacis]
MQSRSLGRCLLTITEYHRKSTHPAQIAVRDLADDAPSLIYPLDLGTALHDHDALQADENAADCGTNCDRRG